MKEASLDPAIREHPFNERPVADIPVPEGRRDRTHQLEAVCDEGRGS